MKQKNKKKILTMALAVLLAFGTLMPLTQTVQAAEPYVDSTGIVHDYGQKHNGVNLSAPLDSRTTFRSTSLRSGAWRVYVDPHFNKKDKKEFVKAIQAWRKKGIPVYLSTDKTPQASNIFIQKPSKKRDSWMTKRNYLGLSRPDSTRVKIEPASYTKITLSTGYIRSVGDHVHTVLEHELGHAFGMMHSPDKNSVMYYSDTGNNHKQYITKTDVEVAKYLQNCLYSGNYYHERTRTVIY